MFSICPDSADNRCKMNDNIRFHIVIHFFDIVQFYEVIIFDFRNKDIFAEAFFQAIHEQGRRLTDINSIARFLAQQGVDEAEFRKAYNSPEAQARLQRANELQRLYAITGVPSVIVDGQYQTSATQAGSYENVLKVIDYLVAMEAGAAGR